MGPDPDPNSNVRGMHLWGWMSEAELLWLGEQAAKMRSVVEIGCLHGRSSYMLASSCRGETYHIDPWNDDGYASWTGSMAELTNAHPIRAASPEAGTHVPDPVDMVFIDGAHDYQSVYADVSYWTSRAEVLLCGHDYVQGSGAGFPDVAIVVDEVFGDLVRVAPETAIWYVDVASLRQLD